MEIYSPAEDSYLLARVLKQELPKLLKKNTNLRLLEIGAGSGIQLEIAKSLGMKEENLFGTDINSKAVKKCQKLGFNCIKSNLFENINEKFDLIIFNPPYLLYDENEPKKSRLNTTAGMEGNEIIIEFLKQAKNSLEKGGIIFIITSSLSKEINFKLLGYKADEMKSEKLFFERLIVWRILNQV